ncbi:VWA domain-containing protein [Candidatus Sumerlaeota bacterium]
MNRTMRLSLCLAAACCVAVATVPAVHGAGRSNDNVVIVLDASGSMNSNMRGTQKKKMDAAKDALREVLKQAPSTTHIGLLVFSASNVRNDWVYPLGPRDDARLAQAINLPKANGSTPLGAYIKKGGDRLLAQRKAQHGYGSYRLLIVTDGEASDRRLVEKYAPDVVSRGITVDVIGVDMESNHTLATKVHSYRRANDPQALRTAVAAVFAEVSETGPAAIGEDAFAEIEPIPTEVAAGMLAALTRNDDRPISGKRPPPPRVRTQAQAPRGQAQPPTVQFDNRPTGSGTFALVIFVALVLGMFAMITVLLIILAAAQFADATLSP